MRANSPMKNAAAAGTIRLGDLTVNRLGFGAMRLCGPYAWGRRREHDNERRVLGLVLELGINFIDTADSYGPEANETLLAETLYPYPSGVVIATKGGLVRPDRTSWVENGRPEHLRRALDGSLRRLRLERIDLYQFHAPDPKVPFAESMGALAELQRAGKIRHLGVSNVTVAQLDRARRIAPIVSVENEYNLPTGRATTCLPHANAWASLFCRGIRSAAAAASEHQGSRRLPHLTTSRRCEWRLHGCWPARR